MRSSKEGPTGEEALRDAATGEVLIADTPELLMVTGNEVRAGSKFVRSACTAAGAIGWLGSETAIGVGAEGGV